MSTQTMSAPHRASEASQLTPDDYWRARPSKAGPGLSAGRDRGLFAFADIASGELIERACTVEIDEAACPALDQLHPVGDFYFEHPTNARAGLMAFGLMSLLNHDETPNADVRFSHDAVAGWLIDLVAIRPILTGQEITYRYKCPLWFEPTDRTL